MSQRHNEQYLGRCCPHPPQRSWGHTALKHVGNHRRAEAEAEGAVTFSYIYEQSPLKAGYQPSCGRSLPHTQRGRKKTQSSMRHRPGTVRSLTPGLQCPLNDCPCAIKPPIVFLLLWSSFLKTPMWNLLYKFVIHFSLTNLCWVMGCQR